MKQSTPPWMAKLKCIAWDLDGTLYPSSLSLTRAIETKNVTMLARRLNISEPVAERLLTEKYQELKSHTKALNALGIDGEQFFLDVWAELDLSQHIQPNPLLVDALTKLSDRWPQVILTNSNTIDSAERKLRLVGFDPAIFAHIYTSVDTGYLKPDIRAFQVLLDSEEMSPAEVLYCGDREETDIAPAHQVGLFTALVTQRAAADRKTVADLVVKSPLEIIALMEQF